MYLVIVLHDTCLSEELSTPWTTSLTAASQSSNLQEESFLNQPEIVNRITSIAHYIRASSSARSHPLTF